MEYPLYHPPLPMLEKPGLANQGLTLNILALSWLPPNGSPVLLPGLSGVTKWHPKNCPAQSFRNTVPVPQGSHTPYSLCDQGSFLMWRILGQIQQCLGLTPDSMVRVHSWQCLRDHEAKLASCTASTFPTGLVPPMMAGLCLLA